MYLNKNDKIFSRYLATYFNWEPEETRFLQKYLKNDMIIVDVGANIGVYSVLFSQCVGKKGKVFAFEPVPENYELLKKNVIANNCANVICVDKAISNHSGIDYMYTTKDNPGHSRLADYTAFDNDKFRKKIQIKSITLDSYFKKNDKIDFIKLDIEGGEMFALEGMDAILSKQKKLALYTEFWPFAIEKSGKSPREFFEKILQYGFKIFMINRGNKEELSLNYNLIEDYSILDQVNLFCQKN